MSSDDNELLTIAALVSRLHYVRLFAESQTLSDLPPPLMKAAQD